MIFLSFQEVYQGIGVAPISLQFRTHASFQNALASASLDSHETPKKENNILLMVNRNPATVTTWNGAKTPV